MCAALSADTVDNLKDFDFSKNPQRQKAKIILIMLVQPYKTD